MQELVYKKENGYCSAFHHSEPTWKDQSYFDVSSEVLCPAQELNIDVKEAENVESSIALNARSKVKND